MYMYYKLCLFTQSCFNFMKFNFTIVQTYLKSTKIKEEIIKTSYFNGVLKRLFTCKVSHNNALKYFLNIQKIFFYNI